jgi:hypothetical protein
VPGVPIGARVPAGVPVEIPPLDINTSSQSLSASDPDPATWNNTPAPAIPDGIVIGGVISHLSTLNAVVLQDILVAIPAPENGLCPPSVVRRCQLAAA